MGLVLLWILNFVISILNAVGCGKAWNQTSDTFIGRLLLWSGAIMAACGFSWCNLVLLIGLSSTFGWLPPEYNMLAAEIGYVILIPVVITTGIVITVDSWVYFWKRPSLSSGINAGYNAYAMYSNISGAIKFFPDAVGDIMSKVGGSSSKSSGDSKGKFAVLALMLVILSLIAGILTTRYIILSTASSTRS